MKKHLILFIALLALFHSLSAQRSDEEINNLLKGDWYSLILKKGDWYSYAIDSINQVDSAYAEYSFFENYFDYQMSIPTMRGITPFTIQDGYLFVTWDTIHCAEYYWKAEVKIIDSNRVVLYTEEDTLQLKRLTDLEYSLSDFIYDRLMLSGLTRKMRVTSEFSFGVHSELGSYFQSCIFRRDILNKLARGTASKEIIIEFLKENFLGGCNPHNYIQIEIEEFIQMIDEQYPNSQP